MVSLASSVAGQELTGQASAEIRGLFQTPVRPGQPGTTVSVAVQPELHIEWCDRSDVGTPFCALGSDGPGADAG